MRVLFAIVLVFSACSEDPLHNGKVTDRWGKPIAGVTIAVTGSAQQLTSGADGSFSVPVQAGDVKVRAGKPGFIKKTMKMVAYGGEGKPSPLLFALYPDPEKNGFYAVGSMQYSELAPSQIKTVGTDIRAFNGLVDVGRQCEGECHKSRRVCIFFGCATQRVEAARVAVEQNEVFGK